MNTKKKKLFLLSDNNMIPNTLLGGNGRYLYILQCNNYSAPVNQYVSVIDTATDTIITTILLTASKNFSNLFYRAVDQTIRVVGLNWVDVIDANPANGTFNTIILSEAWPLGSAGSALMSYLPYPNDYVTTGGSQANINGTNNAPLNCRLGGHSNTPNVYYYHVSNVINANKIMIQLIPGAIVEYFPNVNYHFKANPQFGWYNDLQANNFPVFKVGNRMVAVTGPLAYMLDNGTIGSKIIATSPAMPITNRPFQCYCPNAPGRLFITAQIVDNFISVLNPVYTSYNGVNTLNIEGNINRAAYKDVNESGSNGLMWGPYSGRLYCLANNNANVTNVKKLHVYDPTEALVANMYKTTINLPYELKSDLRVSVIALNTMAFNQTPLFEY